MMLLTAGRHLWLLRLCFTLLASIAWCGGCSSAGQHPPCPSYMKGPDTMLLQSFTSAIPTQYELLFYLKIRRSAVDIGPFAFRITDLASINPLIQASLNGSDADTLLELRPAGTFTGYSRISGGALLVDVMTADEPADQIICQALPGAGPFSVGDIVTFGAASTPAPAVGLVRVADTDFVQPPGFLSLVPMAAQLLAVTAVISEGVYQVEGVTRNVTGGVRLVQKHGAYQLLRSSLSFPIAFQGERFAETYDTSYVWVGASPATLFIPVGSPVIGPTLVALLSELGPVIDPFVTQFAGTVSAQVGGLVIAENDTILVVVDGLALGMTMLGNPGVVKLFAPTGVQFSNNLLVTNVVATYKTLYSGPPTPMVIAELLETTVIPGFYPESGP